MAEAVLSVTLETLRNLLLEEAKFLSGVGYQVEEIQAQLEMMKSFLVDANQRQHDEERVRTWIQQVRRLAYRTEDVLETYAVEAASKRGNGGIKKLFKGFVSTFSKGKALYKVGEEIARIKSEITNLNTSCQTFGIKDLSEGETSKEVKEKQRLLRQTYAHEIEDHFVGMEDDILELVSLITDNERKHQVISIWGMGGLGKTTLARKLFNHGVVRHCFEAFAWVCITQQCQIGAVLQDILRQLGLVMHGDQTAMVRELYKLLKEKKCLVILDDIWELDDWKILRHAFPSTEASSKILLTTRINEVAEEGFTYKLKFMSEAEGLELLQKKALSDVKEKDLIKKQTFDLVGKEIIRKCGNLPLAISVVGGILRHKNSLRDWEMVNKEIGLYLEREKGSKEASNFVQKVLGLSYYELPYYLKPCFLYMGCYQEDTEIWTEQLYQLWIAEGFVLSKHRRTEERMTDVAERYLNELVSRCMVEVETYELSFNPMWKFCRLHDLTRHLCLDKGKDEDFFKLLDITSPQLPVITLSDCERKLSMNFTMVPSHFRVDIFEKVKSKCLRTLVVSGRWSADLLSLEKSGLRKFKLLKVLELMNCQFELPRKISELIHLKYLNLNGSKVKELPSNITNLPYLQTFYLGIDGDIYLPNIFWKMKQLKHIYLPERYTVTEKLQFNDLHELETLHGFQSSKARPGEISGLVNLRSFSGKIYEIDSHALAQIIEEMSRWRKTKWIDLWILGSDLISEQGRILLRKVLLCENLNALRISTPLGMFPPYEPQFCPNLLVLGLWNTYMEEDPMLFLEKLPNLRGLHLCGRSFMGEEMFCDAMAFPQLKELSLLHLPNFEKLRVEKGAMPNLSRLIIAGCDRFEAITDGLNFAALETFIC